MMIGGKKKKQAKWGQKPAGFARMITKSMDIKSYYVMVGFIGKTSRTSFHGVKRNNIKFNGGHHIVKSGLRQLAKVVVIWATGGLQWLLNIFS